MSFCTAISCLDGRTHLPVIRYLREQFRIEYVDLVTEAGPVAMLARGRKTDEVRSIQRRVDVSCKAHGSRILAVVAHNDCAGNPIPDREQRAQLTDAVANLRSMYPKLTVIALWVDGSGSVSEVRRG